MKKTTPKTILYALIYLKLGIHFTFIDHSKAVSKVQLESHLFPCIKFTTGHVFTQSKYHVLMLENAALSGVSDNLPKHPRYTFHKQLLCFLELT